ncbi:hypothetical protein EV183_005448 [Coemansia sp. RSA 2336]|nr:hypothetical protein EV183_005448 [Coemansia sp. RSA 2336]
MPLKDSQACPGFSRDFISTNATTRFAWFPNEDITAFDKALSDYVIGQANIDEFQSVFRCSGLDDLGGFSTDHGKSVIRYHRSMICADIIFSDENIRDCYGDQSARHQRRDSPELQLAEVVASSVVSVRPSAPTPLCRSTCEAWLNSLHTIISNATLCQPDKGNNREASLDSLRKKCDLDMYSGTSDRCVDGEANELKTCGYQRVEDWCRYCDYASEYTDVCASVGVKVGDSSDKAKSDIPSSSVLPGDRELAAELEKQKRQERVFRVVAIVLSIAVGICVIALILLIAMGHRLTSAGIYGRHNPSINDSGKDDSTLLHTGAADDGSLKKSADFVDCFVSAVGKPRQVVRPFFARRDDEISLRNGDVVTLQMAFDDGWVVGKNLTSGYEGTFPLMCVMENLPPSLPAQWSVLPESKNASIENLRNSSRTSVANGRRASSEIPINEARLQSTRNSLTSNRQPNPTDDEQGRGRGILDRIFGAFSPTNSTQAATSEDSGFFKRLVQSPFGAKDKPMAAPPKGRPHSFNVHHVVHVGLTNPNYPHTGDAATPPSTIPSTMRSENRYPVMPTQASLGFANSAHANGSVPRPPEDPRQADMGYGDFAPSNNSQPTTAGNDSMETYQTAEQSAFNSSAQVANFR